MRLGGDNDTFSIYLVRHWDAFRIMDEADIVDCLRMGIGFLKKKKSVRVGLFVRGVRIAPAELTLIIVCHIVFLFSTR